MSLLNDYADSRRAAAYDAIYLQFVEGEVIRTKYVSHDDDTLVTKRSTSMQNAPVTHELSTVVHVQPAKVGSNAS